MKRTRQLLIEAKAGLNPWDSIPEARLAAVAGQCSAAEVAEIIDELEVLSEEGANTPEWDGDTRDDIATAQALFSRLLGLVPPSFIPDIALGLRAGHATTRSWVVLALEAHGAPSALPPLREALAVETDGNALEAMAAAIRRLEGG